MLSEKVLERRKWKNRIYDKLLTSSIFRILPNYIGGNSLTIDVGGNSGYQTYFHSQYNPVVTYEPVPELFEVLESNLSNLDSSHKDITLINKAVTDTVKDVKLYVDVNRLSMTSQMPLVESEEIIVPGVSLDSEDHLHVGFVKVDVEGYELDVLKGAVNLIERDRPTMMVEVYQPWCDKVGFSSEEIFEFFTDREYDILYYYPEKQRLIRCGEDTVSFGMDIKPQDAIAEAVEAVHTLHHLHDGDFLFVPQWRHGWNGSQKYPTSVPR
jgi:FkbM family methyltransferase